MTPRTVTVRIRESDLRLAISDCEDWRSSLADAARGDGYGEPDKGTMQAARRGLAAAARLREALGKAE